MMRREGGRWDLIERGERQIKGGEAGRQFTTCPDKTQFK